MNKNPFTDKKKAKAHSDAILQQLLKNTLNSSTDLQLHKNQHGKPYVDEPVYFSHSNSQQLYAYVITTRCEVAIDVEWQQPDRPLLDLARRYFSAAEYRDIEATEKSEQAFCFYRHWTQKEAWCKLEGGNLWTYLSKQPPSDQSIYLQEVNNIDGFSACVASSLPFSQVRINALGHL
ncbi:4'-phosphopantetheinyl transferase family protein [Marinicella sediminis]|uniref:4'-phosphopantetheinyl transferase family protein n=1 Tax=Marinicella sediminis TaxID=1792834 RepID=UPI0018E321D0|nr:4'-phosphopantetheinyl transferase superfamily protein [Marinicella sediminis]